MSGNICKHLHPISMNAQKAKSSHLHFTHDFQNKKTTKSPHVRNFIWIESLCVSRVSLWHSKEMNRPSRKWLFHLICSTKTSLTNKKTINIKTSTDANNLWRLVGTIFCWNFKASHVIKFQLSSVTVAANHLRSFVSEYKPSFES